MLEELFTYTKLKNETYRFELTPIKINSVLTTTVFSYYDVWAERGIAPQFSIEEEPIWIMGNEQALQRVLQNMIKNGLEHGNKEIMISLQKEGNMAVLQVKNRIKHGEEIDVSQVFDRFYKADMSRNRTSTGLGLSIAKEFVLRMDGKIEASIEGNWFCITIRFKLNKITVIKKGGESAFLIEKFYSIAPVVVLQLLSVYLFRTCKRRIPSLKAALISSCATCSPT